MRAGRYAGFWCDGSIVILRVSNAATRLHAINISFCPPLSADGNHWPARCNRKNCAAVRKSKVPPRRRGANDWKRNEGARRDARAGSGYGRMHFGTAFVDGGDRDGRGRLAQRNFAGARAPRSRSCSRINQIFSRCARAPGSIRIHCGAGWSRLARRLRWKVRTCTRSRHNGFVAAIKSIRRSLHPSFIASHS